MTPSLRGMIASSRTTQVFVHPLSGPVHLFCGSSWGVHASRVDAVDESRGVQLLRERACAHSGDMACRQH